MHVKYVDNQMNKCLWAEDHSPIDLLAKPDEGNQMVDGKNYAPPAVACAPAPPA